MRQLLRAIGVPSLFATTLFATTLFAGPLAAADPSADDILRALAGEPAAAEPAPVGPTVRSFRPATRAIDVDAEASGSGRASGTASVAPAPTAPTAGTPASAAARPTRPAGIVGTIDLAIVFRSGSADLDPRGTKVLSGLATALKSPALADRAIEIIGHTDAIGTDESNLRLSMRRADEVRNRLWTDYGIDPTRILTRGEGQRRLADPTNPGSEANRRVEIRSLVR